MGTFFLGTWIPWKFKQLCSGARQYTEKNYKSFQEKVEVALSLTLREDSQIARDFGLVRNRIGITQRIAYYRLGYVRKPEHMGLSHTGRGATQITKTIQHVFGLWSD